MANTTTVIQHWSGLFSVTHSARVAHWIRRRICRWRGHRFAKYDVDYMVKLDGVWVRKTSENSAAACRRCHKGTSAVVFSIDNSSARVEVITVFASPGDKSVDRVWSKA